MIRELPGLKPTGDLLVNALLSLAVIEWENRNPEAADAAMADGVAEGHRL